MVISVPTTFSTGADWSLMMAYLGILYTVAGIVLRLFSSEMIVFNLMPRISPFMCILL